MSVASIPERNQVKPEDTWDLNALYDGFPAWENDFARLIAYKVELDRYRGRLGESVSVLKEALEWSQKLGQLLERLGHYASLRVTEEMSNPESLERQGRFESLSVEIGAGLSWWDPELLTIPEEKMDAWLVSPELHDFRILLEKTLRYRPHTLSAAEEKLLSLGSQARGAVGDTFEALTNVDLKFGTVATPEGEFPLTQSTFALFLQNPVRAVRLESYDKFYAEFGDHAHTLATLYTGSIHNDIFYSRARGFTSSLERALFPDRVPVQVYENLIATVRESLPVLHRYYAVRKKALKLDRLHHADMYAPMVPNAPIKHTWDQAVERIVEALAPLGEGYTKVLRSGLGGRWCDRYENKGKRSGAFSSGGWIGEPYILMNYHEENLRDLFTLAHEGGHSMHSWHSVRANPFSCYGYTIFEAEVASTFNEQLLARHILSTTDDPILKAAILGKLIEDFVATFFRQTMFAEFERTVHEHAEKGCGLTLEFFSGVYRALLEAYFGPEVELPPQSALEGLRIPHFYRAFYVYKYATGIAASIALAQRVLEGGEAEREDYINFLRSGGSRFPLDSLKVAGVDMSKPGPIRSAVAVFGQQLEEFEKALGSLVRSD